MPRAELTELEAQEPRRDPAPVARRRGQPLRVDEDLPRLPGRGGRVVPHARPRHRPRVVGELRRDAPGHPGAAQGLRVGRLLLRARRHELHGHPRLPDHRRLAPSPASRTSTTRSRPSSTRAARSTAAASASRCTASVRRTSSRASSRRTRSTCRTASSTTPARAPSSTRPTCSDMTGPTVPDDGPGGATGGCSTWRSGPTWPCAACASPPRCPAAAGRGRATTATCCSAACRRPCRSSPTALSVDATAGCCSTALRTLGRRRVEPVARPRFYDLATADGVPYEQLARLHGTDVLATTVVQTCIRYPEATRCRFCAIEASLDGRRPPPG